MLLWRKSAVSLARRTRPRKALSTLSFPTDQGVDDDFVRVTFIDYLGGRHERRGRVGQTLVDVCRAHGMDLLEDDSVNQGGEIHQRVNTDRWTEDLFGEGPQSALSHVIIPDDMLAKLPAPLVSEMSVLDEIDDELRTNNSRLGSVITLTKELDGLEVFVPDPPPSDLP
jgi:hypothetical protein